MKRNLITCFAVAIALFTSSVARAQTPEMPKPQKEHEFLHKFVGDWNSEMKMVPGPDQPAIECQGTQTARMLGGFWVISEGKGEMMGEPMDTVMQLGYDSKLKKYVGTWSDSCTDFMWKYVGTLEGEKLTLETEGPNMTDPTKMAKYRDVVEFKDADHYTLSSSTQGEDGKWTTFVTGDYRRKK